MSEPQNSLRSIFVEALEIEDAQLRAAFLSRACGIDSAVRREVEELIRAHAAARQFLPEQPAAMGVRAALLSSAEALGPRGAIGNVPVTESPGDRIGRYKLLQQIGVGGCGIVYMAEQEEPVRRRVALKVIKLGMDTKQVVARFEAERQALALMDHPNIAKVFDAGATDTGRPYFVMELVRGTKITEYCDENQLSTRERLELFIQVCQAVQHAHQKGVIHRDLKPSNLLVTVNDGVPVPKVIDFGIAKATEGRLTDKTLFTAFQQFLGTPAYMSPEQAVLTSQDIDTRSDIYSLGVLLYELLTGKTPFDTRELLAGGLDELRRTIREKEPLRPSTRLKSMLRKELTTTAKRRRSEPPRLIHLLRGDLDSIVGKCLEKDRARRYETANGLAADIHRHLNNEPIIARPASTIYRLRKVAQRNKWAFATGLAIATALLVGTAVSSWEAVRAKRERQRFQRNVVRQYVANGTRLVNERDLFGSLLWYAKALELDAGDPRREEPHRIRIASVLRQCPKLLNVFSHGDQLYNSEFSTDGSRVVTASADHTARVWDVATGQELLVLHHDAEVQDARFSQDGRRIVTSGRDKSARIWDSRTRQMLHLLEHGDNVSTSCFSPDGRLVATACEDQTVQLWDVATGTRVGKPLSHPGEFLELGFSPDGRLLGSATGIEGTACIWDVATGRKLGQFPHTTAQTGLAFSPDSQRFLTCEGDHLRIWDAATLQEASFSPIQYRSILDFSFSPEGRAILTASANFTAQTWDAATGRPLFSAKVEHTGPITGARISPDGRSFVTAGNDAIARVWSVTTGQPISPPFKAILMIKQAHFNADGRRLLMKSCDQAARVWDLATGDLPGPSRPAVENEQRVMSPDGRLLLCGGQSNIAWIADTQTGQNVAALPHSNGISYASFSRDGHTVLTASERETEELFLWDVPSGRRLNTGRMLATYRVLYAAFSPDDSRLLTCGLDFCAYLWNAHTGEALSDHPLRHRNRVTWGSFSPDGRSVVTASWDKTVRVWDAATGNPLTPPLEHKVIVASASWSADGKRLLTVTTDDYLQVWDLANAEPLTPPRKIRDSEQKSAPRGLAAARPKEDLPRDDRPVADLVLLSQMLAVGRIDTGGNVVPLQLHELTHASKVLKQRYPAQFASSPSDVAEWHRLEAERSKAERNFKAAIFHLDQALANQPGDLTLGRERAELAAALAAGTNHNVPLQSLSQRIPPRDPTAGAKQIDLSTHYNIALQDFPGLPIGLQTLGGCRFDARGLVHVYGTALKGEEATYPERVTDIRVAQKCRRLHFLQATSWEVADGVELGSYVLHYKDGERRELPLVYARDLANWWFYGLPRGSSDATGAVAAWVGHNRGATKDGAGICLYKSTRENPRPDVELVSIDFVSSLSFAAPFLVALTVE